MSKASGTTATKASGKTTKDVYEASGVFTGVWLEADQITIVGLDVPESFAPQLADPDRIYGVNEALAKSIVAHGVKKPIKVGRFTGKIDDVSVTLTCAVDGRQRIKASRRANELIKAKGGDFTVRIPCVPEKDNDPLTTLIVANEHHMEDTPIAKARKAARLRAHGRSKDEIESAFGVNGQTLANWDALLNLEPTVAKLVEKGSVPITLAYELGKMPQAEQAPALQKLVTESVAAGGSADGALKGATALANARNIRTGKKDVDGEPARVSAKLGVVQLKALHETFGPTDDEEWDGDGCEMTYRILEVVLGKDPTAKNLRDWPDVHKAFAKVLRAGR